MSEECGRRTYSTMSDDEIKKAILFLMMTQSGFWQEPAPSLSWGGMPVSLMDRGILIEFLAYLLDPTIRKGYLSMEGS